MPRRTEQQETIRFIEADKKGAPSTVAVKVVYIFCNDTMTIVEVMA